MMRVRKMSIDTSWKDMYKVGGFSLFAAGAVLYIYFLLMLTLKVSLPLNAQVVLDNPVPPAILSVLAAVGEFLLLPGVLGLYFALKDINKNYMVIATALGVVAAFMFLVCRGQVIALLPISGNYMATTSEVMKAAYLASADHAIEVGNVFSIMALMFLAVASILIGLVMLKGVFGKRIGYIVIVAGLLTLFGTFGVLIAPLTILTLFGLILSAVWQIVVGVKLYKLGTEAINS